MPDAHIRTCELAYVESAFFPFHFVLSVNHLGRMGKRHYRRLLATFLSSYRLVSSPL